MTPPEGAGYPTPNPGLAPAPRASLGRRHARKATGRCAGAVLTHGNLIANSAGCSRFVNFAPDDVHISYLPLAHIYERINTLTCTHRGAAIGFYSGDVLRLLDDIAALRPTIFCSVPRLWNRIYDKVTPSSSAACHPPPPPPPIWETWLGLRACIGRGAAIIGTATCCMCGDAAGCVRAARPCECAVSCTHLRLRSREPLWPRPCSLVGVFCMNMHERAGPL